MLSFVINSSDRTRYDAACASIGRAVGAGRFEIAGIPDAGGGPAAARVIP